MVYCGKFQPGLLVTSDNTSIKILKLDGVPPDIEYSLYIYHVDAYKYKKKLPVRDLINGFSNTLDKFSQVDDIITRLCDTPKDTLTELRYIGNNILRLSDEENDSKQRKLTFIGKQLISLTVGKHGKRYTAGSMTDAINLYLRSRSSYRALRELLDLPCRNTIYEYFGKLGLAGSLDECERTVKRVFESLNEGERNCFITFDEIHIKPGLYYPGRYVLGDALNQDSPCPCIYWSINTCP